MTTPQWLFPPNEIHRIQTRSRHKYYINGEIYTKKFYAKECLAYPEEMKIILEDADAEWLTRRLAQDFQIQLDKIKFINHPKHPNADYGRIFHQEHRINLCYQPSLHLICHELAHLLDHQLNGSSRHNKRLWNLIAIIITHANSHYFHPKASYKKEEKEDEQ